MQKLLGELLPLYGRGEARAILRVLVEDLCGVSWGRFVCEREPLEALTAEGRERLLVALGRVGRGEPVQHVLGYGEFCGRRFRVTGETLIPRVETEGLVRWVAEECTWADSACGARTVAMSGRNFGAVAGMDLETAPGKDLDMETAAGVETASSSVKILDIGTGTGCIGITLALEVAGARVTGLDVSEGALEVARGNWERLKAEGAEEVRFVKGDALRLGEDFLGDEIAVGGGGGQGEGWCGGETGSTGGGGKAGNWCAGDADAGGGGERLDGEWDVIVSNPPYICAGEAAEMHRNVLEHEPHPALFVPDEDPLLFYRAIGRYGLVALRDGGRLYFELNRAYAEETAEMLRGMGYVEVEVREDLFGNKRMLRGRKKRNFG